MVVLDPGLPSIPQSVEVTDVRGCQFTFPLDQCRTFFVSMDALIAKQTLIANHWKKALKQSIKVHCFVTMQTAFDSIDIVASDDCAVDGEKWIDLLQKHDSSVIELRLRHKNHRPTTTSARKATYTPVKSSEVTKTSKPEMQNGYSYTPNAVAEAEMAGDTAIDLPSPSKSSLLIENQIDDRHHAPSTDLVTESQDDSIRKPPEIWDLIRKSDDNIQSDSAPGTHILVQPPYRQDYPYTVEYGPEELSYTQRPSEKTSQAAPPDDRAMILYRHITPALHASDILPSLSSSLESTTTLQRKKTLEEKGVLLFDKSTLNDSPEIFTPSVVAVAQLHPSFEKDSIFQRT
jgi:hypothetical protein